MMSSNLCLVLLLLAAAHSVLSLPLHVGSASPSQDNDDLMVTVENEYLTYLYDTIKESGKKPNDVGEFNLLLDDSDKFANMVQCVAPIDSEEDSEVAVSESVQRTIKYNLQQNFMISSTQELVSFRLAIPSIQCPSLYQINVYCSTDSNKPLDSGSSRDKYIDLSLQPLFNQLPFESDTEYELVLEITSPDGAIDDDKLGKILESLKPMLVVYSYDSNIIRTLFQVPETNVVRKRDVPDPLDLQSDEAQPVELTKPTLEERKQEFCQIHTVNLTSFNYFKVPTHFEVTQPAFPSMSFCYGHCRMDANQENSERMSNHARFVGRQDPALIEAEISPCCIPTGYEMTMIILRPYNSGVSIMVSESNHVTGCRCY